MTPAGEADWGRLKVWKNYVIVCHRRQSRLSFPGHVRGAQSGLDKLIFKRFPGSEVPPHTTMRQETKRSMKCRATRNLWTQQLRITLLYLHLGSKVKLKKSTDWLIFKSMNFQVNNMENRFSITTKPVQMVFRVVQSERRLFWPRNTWKEISHLGAYMFSPFSSSSSWWNELRCDPRV